MEGKKYLRWLNDEEQSKWKENFILLNKDEIDTQDFLNFNHSSWVGFIGSSFEFRKTIEGAQYWSDVYIKYKRYDNLTVKKEFNYFSKQPKIF